MKLRGKTGFCPCQSKAKARKTVICNLQVHVSLPSKILRMILVTHSIIVIDIDTYNTFSPTTLQSSLSSSTLKRKNQFSLGAFLAFLDFDLDLLPKGV